MGPEVFGADKLTEAFLDCLTHHVPIQEIKGDSYRFGHSRQNVASQVSDYPDDSFKSGPKLDFVQNAHKR